MPNLVKIIEKILPVFMIDYFYRDKEFQKLKKLIINNEESAEILLAFLKSNDAETSAKASDLLAMFDCTLIPLMFSKIDKNSSKEHKSIMLSIAMSNIDHSKSDILKDNHNQVVESLLPYLRDKMALTNEDLATSIEYEHLPLRLCDEVYILLKNMENKHFNAYPFIDLNTEERDEMVTKIALTLSKNIQKKNDKARIETLAFAQSGLESYAKRKIDSKTKFEIVILNSIEDLFRTMSKYLEISNLYFFIHGGYPQILGDSIQDIINKIIQENFSMPKVNKEIVFFSCRLGRYPSNLLDFAIVFNSPMIIGWTQFIGYDILSYNISSNSNTKKLKRMLERYQDYFIESTPSIEDLLKPATHEIWLEWWHYLDIGDGNLPILVDESHEAILDWSRDVDLWKSKRFPTKKIKIHSIKANNLEELKKKAEELTNEYASMFNDIENMTCEKIVLELP